MTHSPQRRRLLRWAAAGAAASAAALARGEERVIPVVAKKFDFTPAEIPLKVGEAVVLELTSEDVLMGFSAPDFGVDTEIQPGKVTRVRLVPAKAGTFPFVCDIFCGDGHEDMGGRIVVT